jgi:hypothetical protein
MQSEEEGTQMDLLESSESRPEVLHVRRCDGE